MWKERGPYSRLKAWEDLLMEAHYKEENPKREEIAGRVYEVYYGQVLWSYRFMAERWKWSVGKVIRFLQWLKDEQNIDTDTDTAITRITILNYKHYQGLRNSDEYSDDNAHGTPTEHQRNEKKNIKNVKKGKNKELSSPEASGNGHDRCPHHEIIELYHNILPELPRIREWTEKRQAYLRSRWNEKAERQSIAWWESFFYNVKSSDFLTGKVKDFKADLEWLVKPGNFPKVIEGRYLNATRTTSETIPQWKRELEEHRRRNGEIGAGKPN